MIALLAQDNAPVVQHISGRNHFLDVLLVLILVGAALYAVCRSSRRT
jgi:hypothetical protein